MSHTITVKFETDNLRDIPTIGQRKTVMIGGRRTKPVYVQKIEVRAIREYGKGLLYYGEFVLTDAQGMWG